MSAKEKAVSLLAPNVGSGMYGEKEAVAIVDAILDAVGEHFGLLPKGAAGSEALGTGVTDYAKWHIAEARVRELEDDRRRALKRADALTLDTQTCEEAVTSLVSMVRTGRGDNERLRDDLAAANKRIAELEERDPWPRPNASPEPAATEGDWADALAYKARGFSDAEMSAAFREAERRGQVKGLRWAADKVKAYPVASAYAMSIRNEADRLEREGKGEK